MDEHKCFKMLNQQIQLMLGAGSSRGREMLSIVAFMN
jgi:hypothetical protein